jgi:GDP-L-fucose synthase
MRRYLEKLGEFVAEKSGMQIALVRPTAVYGRHDNFDPAASHVIPALIRRAIEREDPYVVWGTGNEVRDFLHVTDLARGCLLMLEKQASCDPVNLGSAQDITIRELVYLILSAADHNMAKVVFDATKPITIPYRKVDMTKAKEILNFSHLVSLKDGITDTLNWYKTKR